MHGSKYDRTSCPGPNVTNSVMSKKHQFRFKDVLQICMFYLTPHQFRFKDVLQISMFYLTPHQFRFKDIQGCITDQYVYLTQHKFRFKDVLQISMFYLTPHQFRFKDVIQISMLYLTPHKFRFKDVLQISMFYLTPHKFRFKDGGKSVRAADDTAPQSSEREEIHLIFSLKYSGGVLYLASEYSHVITMYETPQQGTAIPAKATIKVDRKDQNEKKQEARISPLRHVISVDPVKQLEQTLSETGIHESILMRLSKDLICKDWRFFFRALS
ncbi:hypothetical protein ACJMK2_000256, partial [Sinanodonta woodiana]